MTERTLKKLLNVSKGIIPPDTVIKNANVINVFTNTIDEDVVIAIKDGWIVFISDKNNWFCGEPKIIDAKGLFLCPGFIDAHTHIDSMYPFYEFVPYAIKGGTTTVITECAMIANASGFRGIENFIKSTKGYPLRCYFVAPPLTPPLPEMEESVGITMDEFKKLLKRKDFLGIGEAYWKSVVDGDERVLEQAACAISLNKALDGHSSGAKGQRLNEYLVTGITSCHESVNLNEAIEKIKNGVYVMIREGWVRRELKELSRLADTDVDKRRLILVSDVFDAVMLCEEGYMDAVVKKAIEYSFSFFDAIKMATINPADYHRLRFLGAIAPLRYADIIFLKDIKDLSIEKIMVNGEIVYEENKFLKTLKPYNYPEALKHTIKIGNYKPEDFLIKAEKGEHRIRVIEISTQTITKEVTANLVSKNGFLEKDLESDIIHVAVINKTKPYQFGKGFIKGTGIKNGAIATTIIWDTCNILVIGSNEKDMAIAVQTLKRVQGGCVIVSNGKVIYEFPMPVFGTIPLNSIEEVRDKTLEFSTKLKIIGSNFERPFLTIQTIPFTGLPFLRITDKGIVDIKNKKLVSIFL